MKMVKSLFLGSAAALVAVAGAQAADLPVKAKPVQYVKICTLYGAGFYYIPGTDTCIKIGGYVRAEMNFQANGSFNPVHAYNFDFPGRDIDVTRVRLLFSFDVRSQTEYGTLRAYAAVWPTMSTSSAAPIGGTPYVTTGVGLNPAFVQFAGFTAGSTASFFDFDLRAYSNQTEIWQSNQAGNGIPVFGYTAQFGNGFSASIAAEDATYRRSSIAGLGFTYQGRRWPDGVANLRIDQAWGSAQIEGAVHDTAAFVPGTGITDEKIGWAVGGGVKFNLPQIGNGDYVIASASYGEGAVNYQADQFGAGGIGALNYQTGYPLVTKVALGPVFDAVGTGPSSISLTKSWSVTAGFEHRWNPNWKTSLYGSYGEIKYGQAASDALAAAFGIGLGGHQNASWTLWQIGSRTVWTPVQNLDLSVEVLYTNLNNSGFAGAGGACAGTPVVAAGSAAAPGCHFGSQGFVSGMFRVQRNFWP